MDLDNQLAVLQEAPLPVIAYSDARLVWANRRATALPGMKSWLGQPLSVLPAKWQTMLQAGESGRIEAGTEAAQVVRPLQYTLGPLTLCYLIDITGEQELRDRVRDLTRELELKSQRDEQTGLLNMAGLRQLLEAEVARSRRYNNPLSLIRLEIDGKGGHSTAVMRSIAHLLNDRMRWADMIGNIDDRTILFILPETEERTAQELTAKIRDWMSAVPITDGSQAVSVACRIGAAAWQKGDDSRTLLGRLEQTTMDKPAA